MNDIQISAEKLFIFELTFIDLANILQTSDFATCDQWCLKKVILGYIYLKF